jgi:hypothetical protein
MLLGEPIRGWIEASRNAAANTAVQSIPDNIRTRLAPLFPPHVLHKARYTTDVGAVGSLQWFTHEQQDGGAITLDNIIVFFDGRDVNCEYADPQKKAACIWLWAHELEHVLQYDRLGIEGFAQAYVDQTCILPGNDMHGGYESDRCQIERWADKKANLLALNRDFLDCCTLRVGAVPTVEIRDRVLSTTEEFRALDTITVGPNVTLQGTGDVTLRAGNRIIFTPAFQTELGGRLSGEIIPSMAGSCQASRGSR